MDHPAPPHSQALASSWNAPEWLGPQVTKGPWYLLGQAPALGWWETTLCCFHVHARALPSAGKTGSLLSSRLQPSSTDFATRFLPAFHVTMTLSCFSLACHDGTGQLTTSRP